MGAKKLLLTIAVFQAYTILSEAWHWEVTSTVEPSPTPSVDMSPCWSYYTLSDASRNINYKGSCYGNDAYNFRGWFRFRDAAGDRMLDYCPYQYNNNECSAIYKGWMQGRLPEVYQGAVFRYAYFAYRGNCYYTSAYMYVQNCGGFYVYKFYQSSVPGCNQYCGIGSMSSSVAEPLTRELPQTSTPVLPRTTPASQSVDGCRHYQTLSEGGRAVTDTSYWNYRQCDDKLYGWYRFMGNAGNRMLDYCPLATGSSGHKCGAYYQGWITSGSKPSVYDGEVSRLVCFSSYRGCSCQYQQQIKIRNCGSFYVYWITSVPTCSLRYCGVKDKTAEVTCSENFMRIDLDKRFFNASAYSSITLQNPACKASWSTYSSHISLGTFPSQCDSKRRDTYNYITYENEVIMKAKPTTGMITRNNDIRIRFECSYKKDGFVSTVSFKPVSTVNATEVGIGNFSFYFRMYTDKYYSKVHSYFPVKINLRDWLYFEAYARVSDKKLVVLVDQCYSTPTMDRNHPQKYVFINERRAIDSTVKFHKSDGMRQRFSIQGYKYINSTAVYIHCIVFVCYEDSTEYRCSKGSDGNTVSRVRARRDLDGGSAYAVDKKDYSKYYLVEAGPLVLEDSKPDPKSGKEISEGGISTTTILLIAGVALLVIIIALLVVKMRRTTPAPAATPTTKQLEIGIDNAPGGKEYVIMDESPANQEPEGLGKKEESF